MMIRITMIFLTYMYPDTIMRSSGFSPSMTSYCCGFCRPMEIFTFRVLSPASLRRKIHSRPFAGRNCLWDDESVLRLSYFTSSKST
ncbi:MAG: hypothetical protein LBM08_04375 [Dysgonamonadaceae bacterium]|nr:hypothetical protein [Dysgonamonadaceae bacterium]